MRAGMRPLVVCGPSGVGKGSILDFVLRAYPGTVRKAVSHTTRAARRGEVHGRHYFFSERPAMEEAIRQGGFVESAEVHGALYGTSLDAVRDVGRADALCLLEIDVQGAEAVRKSSLDANFCFILPPSIQHLEARLVGRGSETSASLRTRLANAAAELAYMRAAPYPHCVVTNDQLETACEEFMAQLRRLYPQLHSIQGPARG